MPLEEVYRRRIVPGFGQGTPQASILPHIGGGFYNGGYWSFSTIVCADGSYYMPDLLLNRGWCWKGDPPTAPRFPGDSDNNGSAGGHSGPKNPTATKWSAQLDTAQFVDGGWQQNKNMFVGWDDNNCGGYTPDQNPAKASYTITSVLKFLKWNTSSRAFDTLKTVDEAIAKALKQLGVEREDINVTILNEGKSGGLFGLGSEDALISVELLDSATLGNKAPEPTAEAVVTTARETLEELLKLMDVVGTVDQKGSTSFTMKPEYSPWFSVGNPRGSTFHVQPSTFQKSNFEVIFLTKLVKKLEDDAILRTPDFHYGNFVACKTVSIAKTA